MVLLCIIFMNLDKVFNLAKLSFQNLSENNNIYFANFS